ncbi:hypothetical protein COBT_000998 [Conglomerata obtusa]
MIYKILDQLQKEDTFDFFTSHNITKLSNDTQSVTTLKIKIENFFREIATESECDTLIYNECCRMLRILEKIYEDLEDEDEAENGDDCIVALYIESLKRFVDGVDDEHVKRYVAYITD